MGYPHDTEAVDEASALRARLASATLGRLREMCHEVVSPSAQEIEFDAADWAPRLVNLGPIADRGRISREDVREVARRVADGRSAVTDLFMASYVWGMGDRGYGPHRYDTIVAEAGDRLQPVLKRAWELVRNDHPAVPYSWLYGDNRRDHRLTANDVGSGRISHFGPAFFTKFLFFARSDETEFLTPLILDVRLARAVAELSKMPHMVASDGRSVAWTPYRYAVYLHWMGQVSRDLGVSPDTLEIALFRGGAPEDDESQAGE